MAALPLAFTITFTEVYLFCLFVGLAFAAITAIMGGLGGDHGLGHDIGGHDIGGHDVGGHDIGGHAGGADAGAAGAHAGGLTDSTIHFSPLSPVVLAMFITCFGGFGLLGDKGLGLPWLVHLPLATIAGFALAAVTFYLMARMVLWAQGSSQASVTEALGLEAETIIPIPASGVGRVAYCLRGRRFTAAARAADGSAIPGHTMVVIEDVSSSTFVVRPSAEEQLRKLTPPANP
jgi:hypothetical protein